MIENFTIFFAFLAMIFWGVGDFLVQKTVRKIGNFETLIWINLMAGIGLLPFVAKNFEVIMTPKNLLALVAMGVIDFFFGVILLKAYDKGKLSVVDVVMIAELPFTVMFGLVALQEKLSFLQVVLILFILVGIFIMTRSPKGFFERVKDFIFGQRRYFEKGVALVLLAAILSSIYNFLITINSRNIDAFTAIWFPWVISLIMLVIYVRYKKGFGDFWRISMGSKKVIFWTGIIDTAAWVFYALALSHKELSVTTAITESYPAISIFLAVRFNKEKITKYQYFGASMALLGSILISIF